MRCHGVASFHLVLAEGVLMVRRPIAAVVTAATCGLLVVGVAYLVLPDVMASFSDSASCAICWIPPLLTIGGATGAAAAAGGYWGWSAAEREREAAKAREEHNSFDPNDPGSSPPGQWVETTDDGSPPILHAPDPDEDPGESGRAFYDYGRKIPGQLGDTVGRVEDDFIDSDFHRGSIEPEDDD